MSALSQELTPARVAHEEAPSRQSTAALRLEFVTDEAWEAALSDFRGACQEQMATFACHRWPGMSREAVLFRGPSGAVVGGCQTLIQSLPLGLSRLAIVKWGPLLRQTGGTDARVLYGAMVDRLMEEYAEKRRMMLSILPRASTGPGNPEFESLTQRGFRAGAALPFPKRYFVNLTVDSEAQRKSLEQKWRYHLNKSEKVGLQFEHAGPERLPEFDRLYRAMLGRKQFADHSAYETVPALMALDSPLRPALFLVSHEGQTVAGALIFTAGDEAVYLYGATTNEALALRAGYFMHWRIISWLKEHTAARWYDLGGTDGFSGLHQFKKGMVGTAGVISAIPPVANYAAHPVPRIVGRAAFAARDLLTGVQRFIDDHRAGRARRDLRPGAGQDDN